MKFVAAKCPNCKGDLQVPDNKDVVKCMYCGGDIFVREVINVKTDYSKEILLMDYEAEKLLKQAETGFSSEKKELLKGAIDIFQKILVIDNINESAKLKLDKTIIKLFDNLSGSPLAKQIDTVTLGTKIKNGDMDFFINNIDYITVYKEDREVFAKAMIVFKSYCKDYPDEYIPIIEKTINSKVNVSFKEPQKDFSGILGVIFLLILTTLITKKESSDIKEKIVRLCEIALKGDQFYSLSNNIHYGSIILTDESKITLFTFIKDLYKTDAILKKLDIEYKETNDKIRNKLIQIRNDSNRIIERDNKELIISSIKRFSFGFGIIGFFLGIFVGCQSCFATKGAVDPGAGFRMHILVTISGAIFGAIIGYLIGYLSKKKLV